MGGYVLLYITILTYIAENLYLFTLYSVNYKIPCILYIKFNFSKIIKHITAHALTLDAAM